MTPLPRSQPEPIEPRRHLEIIVADDVVEITDLISRWLEEEGHTVTRAASGRGVLELVQNRAYDVLVTDIVMPDGDGWDVILAVGRLRPATRILAISGGGKQMPVDACLRVAKGVGADLVLKKPFRRPEFLAALNKLVS